MSHEVLISPTVLVTGAAGRLGPPLVRALAARGYGVRVLVRKRLAEGVLPPGVDVFYANVDQPQTVAPALVGCNWLFHLAALWAPAIPDAPTRQRLWRTNVDAVAALVQMAQQQGVGRLVYCSTTQVYGHGDGQTPASEETPLRPLTTFAQTKWAGEQIVLEAQTPVQTPLAVVLRLAPLCNSVEAPMGERRRIGRKEPVSYLHVADAVQAALLAAASPLAGGKIYNISSGCVEYAAWPSAGSAVPSNIDSGGGAGRLRCWLGWATGTSGATRSGATDETVCTAKAQRELGFRPGCRA